jgi:hypothetical protein
MGRRKKGSGKKRKLIEKLKGMRNKREGEQEQGGRVESSLVLCYDQRSVGQSVLE